MSRVFVVAEIGCNHNGSAEMAYRMVKEAAECGIDAIKFQAFSADALISRYAPKAEYQIETTGSGDTQLDMTRALELTYEEIECLTEYAESLGVAAFSTPFDLDSIDFLASHGQRLWKIPSGEITNLPYLERLGSLITPGMRVLLSTGMATVGEIRACLNVLTGAGVDEAQVTVLHCNTEYPTPDCDVNVSAILALKEAFPRCAVGLSDHSRGSVAAVMAVALGASVIEKHFTLDRSLPGPDHKASATPEELCELVQSIRRAEEMRGFAEKVVTDSERKNMVVARKSIVASRRIRAGEVLDESNVTCKRPGNGISPMRWHELIGTRAKRDFLEDELIEAEGFEWQMV